MCSFFFQLLKSCYATCVFSVTLSPFPLLTLSLSHFITNPKSTTSNKPLMSHVYGLETYTYSILIEQKPKMTFGMFTICLDDCIRFILSMVGMIMSPHWIKTIPSNQAWNLWSYIFFVNPRGDEKIRRSRSTHIQ